MACFSACTQVDVELDEDGYARACKLEEIPPTGSKRVKLNGKQIALFRYEGSKLYALANSCSHAGVGIVDSDIEDIDGQLCITCPGHGYMFDIKTGKCIQDSKYVQRRYRTKVTEGIIYILLK